MVKDMLMFWLLLVAVAATTIKAFRAPPWQQSCVPLFKKSRHSRIDTFLGAGKKKKVDEFDMQELRYRIDQEDNPFRELFDKIHETVVKRPKQVHVILFNAGTAQQGAHTIEYPRGSGTNVILAFESRSSCKKFSSALKDQDFFDPMVSTMVWVGRSRRRQFDSLGATNRHSRVPCFRMKPHEFDLDKLASFCEAVGVFVQLIPTGTELIPPSERVKNFGNNRNLRRDKKSLEYTFEMLDYGQESDGLIHELESDYAESAWL